MSTRLCIALLKELSHLEEEMAQIEKIIRDKKLDIDPLELLNQAYLGHTSKNS